MTYRTIKLGGGMQGFLAATVGHDEETKKNLERIDCLVVGESGNLTDTILVCSYDPKNQQAVMLSIPRDTFTGKNKNKATAYNKINVLYHESPQKLLNAVNDITGLNLKYYVKIDTKSLRELVDTIGGVEFDVPMDMNYDDDDQNLHIHLKAGLQKLNGQQAEGVLRFRHNNNGTTYSDEYGQQDIGRMKTQRAFITTVLKNTLNFGNILKIGNFLDIIEKNVETNVQMSLIKDYIPYALEFNPDSIRAETLPGTPEKCNEVWLYIHNKTETEALIDELFGNKEENSSETTDDSKAKVSNIKVEVLNGSGVKANLDEVTNKLKEKGYTISKTGTTSSTAKTTIINRTDKSKSLEDDLKELFDIATVSSGKDNSQVDFSIIIGKDYK